jgi:hypothetical protein
MPGTFIGKNKKDYSNSTLLLKNRRRIRRKSKSILNTGGNFSHYEYTFFFFNYCCIRGLHCGIYKKVLIMCQKYIILGLISEYFKLNVSY